MGSGRRMGSRGPLPCRVIVFPWAGRRRNCFFNLTRDEFGSSDVENEACLPHGLVAVRLGHGAVRHTATKSISTRRQQLPVLANNLSTLVAGPVNDGQ